jgi:hypothetical protein
MVMTMWRWRWTEEGCLHLPDVHPGAVTALVSFWSMGFITHGTARYGWGNTLR